MKKNICALLVAVAFLSACTAKPDQATEANPEKDKAIETDVVQFSAAQMKNGGIEIGTAVEKEVHETIQVNGTVDVPPENVFSVSVPLGGYVRKMMLIPGMLAKKGSVLATVEDQQYIQLQQDYLTAKNRLKFSEADYIRQKGLNATKATSDKLFQQTESEFNNQKVLMKSLAEKLRLIGINPDRLTENNISRSIVVYAPISGYVSKVNVNSGKYVNASDVLFELINPSALHADLTVFEKDAAQLKVGQKIVCTTTSNPDQKYIAVIHLISPNINDDRSMSVHCDLENFDKALLPGTFLNASIETNGTKGLSVPDEAIVKWENKFYIFQAEGNNRFKMVNVEPGKSTAGFTQLKTPFSGNLVVKNAYAVLMKMKNSEAE